MRSSLLAFLQPTSSTSLVVSSKVKTVPFSLFLSASEQQEATVALTATSTTKTFEAVAPDTNILIGFGIAKRLYGAAAFVVGSIDHFTRNMT